MDESGSHDFGLPLELLIRHRNLTTIREICPGCFDDWLWYVLVYVRAYEWLGVAAGDDQETVDRLQYLESAQHIWNTTFSMSWDERTCGGGLWWKKNTFKSGISTSLALHGAALLHRAIPGDVYYLHRAHQIWEWIANTPMINPATGLAYDGVGNTTSDPNACSGSGKGAATYIQGVLMGGLAMLYEAGNRTDAAMAAAAVRLANETMNQKSVAFHCGDSCDRSEVRLLDDGVTGSQMLPPLQTRDFQSFKGIFLRYLPLVAPLTDDDTRNLWAQFVRDNAEVASYFGQDAAGQFAGSWQGPVDSCREACSYDTDGPACSFNLTGAAPQAAAVDLFTALSALSPKPTLTPTRIPGPKLTLTTTPMHIPASKPT